MVKALALLAVFTAQLPPSFAPEISVVPEMSVVPLASGPREVRVMLRNLSLRELEQLRLEPTSAAPCSVVVLPDVLPRLSPSDRGRFTLRLGRTENSGRRRFPVEFRLHARGRADLASFRLLVDAGRATGGAGDGWLDVGVVKVGDTEPESRAWALAALALLPVALLLLLGRRLKRKAAE